MQQAHANDQLSAYLDGELDEAEVSEVEAALANDPALREELAKLDRVAQLLRAHGPVRAPEGFKAAVLSKVAEMPQPAAAPWWRRPFGVPIEGVVLALAAAMVLWIALPTNVAPVPEGIPTGPAAGDAEVAAAVPAAAEKGDLSKEAAQQQKSPKADLTDGVAAVDQQGTANTDDPYVGAKGEVVEKPAPTKGWVDSKLAGNTGNTANTGLDNTAVVDNTGGIDEAPVQEAQEGGKQPAPVMTSGQAYTLYTDDPGQLLAIRRIVSAHKGDLANANGSPLTEAELNAAITQLIVNLPADQVSDLVRQLGALGKLEATGSSTKLYGEQMQMTLTVKLIGGATSNSYGTKNAARNKKMTQGEDALEASDILE